jgi:3,4-dihydroxy 2-butanone 4-phosphate synthase/GTP cyclohydrolase II
MPRPTATLAFAQSLDGSLAAGPGQPLALSGPESLAYTHSLRAAHAAILIGLGTVLADDPQLTVRYAAGPNPQPIVLDSQLRFPLTARLLRHPSHSVWIAATEAAPRERQSALEAAGACVLRLPRDEAGHVALPALLDALGARGFDSLMVEGGARVLTAFLAQRLAQRVSLTIAPRFIGGLKAIAARLDVSLYGVQYRRLGDDLVVEGELPSASGRAAGGEGVP